MATVVAAVVFRVLDVTVTVVMVAVAVGGDRRAGSRAHGATDDGALAAADLVADRRAGGATQAAADGGIQRVTGVGRGGQGQGEQGDVTGRNFRH